MHDSKCNQNIRREIAVHMGMKIRAEFHVPQDISLKYGLRSIQTIILGLAHQGFGNRRDRSLHLDPPVGVDIRHLGVCEAQNIDLLIACIDVAGNLPANHLQTLFIHRKRQTAESGEVPDQISRMVIGSLQLVIQASSLPEEADNHILLIIQKQTVPVFLHGCSLLLSSAITVTGYEQKRCSSLWPPHRSVRRTATFTLLLPLPAQSGNSALSLPFHDWHQR